MMEKKAPEEEVGRLMSEGWELRNSGELEKALQCFDRATKIAPHNPDAWSNKGCILGEIADKRMMTHEDAAKTGRKALKCFDRALKISPNDGVLWSNKGEALLLLGKKEEGLDCYDRSTELEPESSMLWLNRGLAYLMFEYYADALRYFDRAVELDTGNREAWVQKYLIHKRWDEIFEMFECAEMLERIDTAPDKGTEPEGE